MKAKAVSLADVAAEPAPDSESEMGETDDSDFDAAAAELATVVGVPDDKLEALKAALQAVILTCK